MTESKGNRDPGPPLSPTLPAIVAVAAMVHMVPTPQPAMIVAAPPTPPSSCSGPCAMQWCGGWIINFAAFGFLIFSTALSWPLGMIFAYVYAAALLGGVLCLEKKLQAQPAAGGELARTSSEVDRSLAITGRSLLYIFALVFVFIGGLFIPINVIGGDSDGSAPPYLAEVDLLSASALPSNASEVLRGWVALGSTCGALDNAPSYAIFQGFTYVSAHAAPHSSEYSTSTNAECRSPAQIYSPGKLPLLAIAAVSSTDCLAIA
eukprot:SAG11_NODE_1450_length_4883_cov_2.373955_8_plen_262_part_00